MKKKVRNFLALLFSKILIAGGFVKRAIKYAKENPAILSVYFHNPTKKEFLEMIRFFKKHGFKFLSISEIESIFKQEIQFPKAAVFITVDDGWASNRENMALIAEVEKVPITIFVATEAIEEGNYWFRYIKEGKKKGLFPQSSEALKKIPNKKRLQLLNEVKEKLSLPREAMDVETIMEIDQLAYVDIEGHSDSHPILTMCDDQELSQEINKSKNKLESWLKREIKYFAYPNGDYGKREINDLKNNKFKLGFANYPEVLQPKHLSKPFEIPRIGFLEGASYSENICRMVGVWHKWTFKIFKK